MYIRGQMSRQVVTFKIDSGVLEEFDALTERAGYVKVNGEPNRSAMLRHLIARAVGDSGTSAALEEEVTAMHAKLRERAGAIGDRLRDIVMEELDLGE